MNPTPGTVIANRFQLVCELGRGTMGTVWLAQHLTLDVRCALKFMSAEAAREPAYTARFALEARAIAQIQSPNIVRVLDYDLWEGVPFIAMERLVGEDLAARLQRVRQLGAAGTCRVVSQVARGLARAHGAGIVHRDLKPENIFLAREGDDEIAKLVDFGIAKFEGRAVRRTQMGEVLGTPAYMSPEQTRCAQTIDARSDLWALGAIAFECLTGRLAFDGDSLGDIFARILVEPLPVPSHVAPDLPPAFDSWFARAVSRDPEGRFTDAREMAEALERALDGRRGRLELVTARSVRPAPGGRLWGGALAFAVLSLVGVFAVLAWLHHVPVLARLRSTATTIAATMSDRRPAPAPEVVRLAPAPAPEVVRLAPESAPEIPAPETPAPELAALTPAPETPSPVPTRIAPASSEVGPRAPGLRHRRAKPPRSVRAAAEVQRAEVARAQGQRAGECVAGQRRCSGSVLQLCNAALDGWTDFIDCGESALCDATASGSGPCVPMVGVTSDDAAAPPDPAAP